MSNEKRTPGCVVVGDYTTRLCGDYSKPLHGFLLNNQDSMESKKVFFFVAQMGPIFLPFV